MQGVFPRSTHSTPTWSAELGWLQQPQEADMGLPSLQENIVERRCENGARDTFDYQYPQGKSGPAPLAASWARAEVHQSDRDRAVHPGEAMFKDEGFSRRATDALLGAGIDFPYRLLFMPMRKLHRCFGRPVLAEIFQYQNRVHERQRRAAPPPLPRSWFGHSQTR